MEFVVIFAVACMLVVGFICLGRFLHDIFNKENGKTK